MLVSVLTQDIIFIRVSVLPYLLVPPAFVPQGEVLLVSWYAKVCFMICYGMMYTNMYIHACTYTYGTARFKL